jgi:hypothetical protein
LRDSHDCGIAGQRHVEVDQHKLRHTADNQDNIEFGSQTLNLRRALHEVRDHPGTTTFPASTAGTEEADVGARGLELDAREIVLEATEHYSDRHGEEANTKKTP